MLFNKKEIKKEDNLHTKTFKTLWNHCCVTQQQLREQVYEVEASLGVVNLYPNDERNLGAIEELKEEKERLMTYLDEYHKAILALWKYFDYYSEDIETDWHPSQWKPGEEVIKNTYKTIHNLHKRA